MVTETTSTESTTGNLCLSRRPGERIMVGDDVIVSVESVKGNKVRIKITARKGVPIHREEVYRAIQKEKEGAA